MNEITDTPAITVPIRMDKDGNIRVGGTRVTLDVIVARFQQGYTPEQINQGFPTVKVADIYVVISYYLSHKDEVDDYLRRQAEESEQIRREIEAKRPDIFDLEAKLRERLAQRDR